MQGPVAAQPTVGMDAERAAQEAARYWWLSLVTGIAWLVAALVVLQFDAASVKTVGLILGCMFLAAGVQQLLLAAIAERLRWLFALFGVLFVACGIAALFNPEDTFAGVADLLGFLFLIVGVSWIVSAFSSPVRWMHLAAGVLMVVMAFWTSGQFFIEKAYVLLVFAGIWALLHGVTDIVGAFVLRSVKTEPAPRG
jgi:uncharacterized membrane protein HdeD (DUF308 family)